MKARPMKKTVEDGRVVFKPCEPGNATHLRFSPPGPYQNRLLPLGPDGWQWNGDVDRPTLTPSILTHEAPEDPKSHPRCHSYVTDGQIRFLGDCTHELAGQTLDLQDLD